MRNPRDEYKPFMHRDGVLIPISGAGSAMCFYLASTSSSLATAFNAWGYVLGGICALIVIGVLIDYSNKKRDKR